MPQYRVGVLAPNSGVTRDMSIEPVVVEAANHGDALGKAYEQGLPNDDLMGHWVEPVDED